MNKENFTFHWFGFWKEHREDYKSFPSIVEFIHEDYEQTHDVKGILKYLNLGHSIAATSGWSFNNPFTLQPIGGSISEMTDGKFIWCSDLPLYIKEHHVAIPEHWYQYMKSKNFQVDDLSILSEEDIMKKLEPVNREISVFLR
jgi:hypothetical protein